MDACVWPTATEDKVMTLYAVGKQVAAGTGWHGVLLAEEGCKSWKTVGASALGYAPEYVRSIASDDAYLYAAAEGGVYRFPLVVHTVKPPHSLSAARK